jgi:hypothetical protein
MKSTYQRPKKQHNIYVDQETRDRFDNLRGGKPRLIFIQTLLDLTEKYGLLDPDWIKNLFNSEIGEKLKKETIEKIRRDSSLQSIAEVNHNCPFVCPFISDKDSNMTFCMCEWSTKRRIIKVTTQWCNICFQKGYVIPKPKTEAELRLEEERRAAEKREQLRQSTRNVSPNPNFGYSKPNTYEKFREPFNDR